MKFGIISVTTATAIAMSGCAAQQIAKAQHDRAEAQAELQNSEAICDAQWPKRVGNYVARARCFNDALSLVAPRLGLHADLVEIYMAARASLAPKVDSGQLTPEDARLQLAELAAGLKSEQQRRTDAQAAVIAPLLFETLRPAPTYQLPMPAAPDARPPINTLCSMVGNSIYCNSH